MLSTDEPWRLNNAVYDQCLEEVYAAASGLTPWADACTALSQAMNLFGVHIIGVNKRSGQLLFSWEGGEISKECFFDYVTQYHPDNPRLTFGLALQGDDWVHDHVNFDEQFVDQNPFFQDFAIPYGVRHLSGTKLVDNDQLVVMFGAVRSPRQLPLNDRELHELVRFRRHLVKAMSIYLSLRDTIGGLSAGQHLLSALPYPVCIANLAGELVYANSLANQLCDKNLFTRSNDGVFKLTEKTADLLLSEALHEIRHGVQTNGRAPVDRFVIPIGSPKRHSAIIGIVVDPVDSMQSFGVDTLVLLLIHEINHDLASDPFIIGKVFDLTPAESMVAASMAGGGTPLSIAEDRGVSEHTIRSQVRSIYSKLDIGSHAELTRRLMGIPIPAPRERVRQVSSQSRERRFVD